MATPTAPNEPPPVRSGCPAARSGLEPVRPLRGRAAATNPPGRFERLQYVLDAEALETLEADRLRAEGSGAEALDEDPAADAPAIPTLYLRDPSRSAISTNDSPDIGFDASLNPYRGCEHACAYCYARPTHEYLGFSAGLDFETRILVKEDLPRLLRKELAGRRWRPQVIALSGVTDAYQPIERKLELTRRCLEVLLEVRNPVTVITKNALVARDADLLSELARLDAASANLSITTLDPKLARALEPRASQPQQRLRAIEELARAGVPVGVMVAPVIPGLNDHEIPSILAAARDAGARFAGMIVLRLPHGLKDLFGDWLARHRPDRRERVLSRIRDVRGGRLNDTRFGARMRGQGLYARQIQDLFELQRRRVGLDAPPNALSTAHFRRPDDAQLDLFGAVG
jgi:DNA repair photolyase